jgi:hypothetical protein
MVVLRRAGECPSRPSLRKPEWRNRLMSVRCALRLAVLLMAGSAFAAPALAAECSGAAIEPSLQSPGRAAAGVVSIGSRIVLIDDAGPTKQLLVCEIEAGSFVIKERIDLPPGIAISKIEAQGTSLILQTEDGQRIEKSIGPKTPAEAAGRAEAVPPEGFRFSATKRPDDSIVLSVPASASPSARQSTGPATEIQLNPIVPGARIFTRKVLNVDPVGGTVTVFWDEVGYGTRAFIAIFKEGRIVAGAQIPLNEIETVPENFTGVLADGRPYYLQTRQGKTVPVILELDSAFAEKAKPNGPLIEQFMREWRERSPERPERRGDSANPPARLASPASPEAAQGTLADDNAFQTAVRQATGDDPELQARAAPALPVSRADVAKCAEQFRDLSWLLTPGSYQRAGVPDECSPPGRFWRRPHYLNGKSGQQVVGVPYCWGCSHSLEQFLEHVKNATRLAGHSCTCRSGNYCIRSDATGVDCSGFVSQCWKSGYYTTSNMRQIADPIDKSNMKKGDAFNLAGSHIRLFMDVVETPTGSRFRVIEAANGEGRIGRVIEEKYTASQLSRYTAIRYKRIVD